VPRQLHRHLERLLVVLPGIDLGAKGTVESDRAQSSRPSDALCHVVSGVLEMDAAQVASVGAVDL
jgi:hypothetical protein